MKLLIIINLSLVAVFVFVCFYSKGDSPSGQHEQGEPRRRIPGGAVEKARGIGDFKRVQVVQGDQWNLNEGALAGVRLDAITPGSTPRVSDEICELIEATPEERSELDRSLLVAFEQVKALELAELSMEEGEDGEDGENWIRVGEHISQALHNLGVLQESVERIVGQDRATILMHGVRQHYYFKNPGLQSELFFFVPEEGGVSFSVKKYRAGHVFSDESFGESRLAREDGFDQIKWRYGHLFDVEVIQKHLKE